jgi:SMI1 / KNR4 family (SUKH-1)
MIDFNQFWAEPGCLPGMSPEETQAFVQQMAAHFQPQGGASFDPTGDLINPGPGLTADQISTWEGERGVRLPDVLRQAFAKQNGGFVLNTQLRILPLEEIANPDDDFWEFACCEEEDVPDRGLIYRFAEEQEVDGELFLNFNPNGPQGEPAVMSYHSDPGDLNPYSKSVTKFLTRMLETFDAPSVDWSETEQAEIVARETIEMSALHPAQLEQVLVRQDGLLVLFTREHSVAGELLSRTTLPEPLSKDMSMIDRRLATFALMLYPEESDGIVQLESKQMRNGRWKNSTMKGAPVYVQFESPDRARLEELRKFLLGETASIRAQAREGQQEKLQQKMQAMSPEQQQATMMQAMLQQLQQMREQHGPPLQGLFDPGKAPPEAAQLHALMQQRLREIEQRARETIAKHPTDPETLRLMQEMMEPPEADEGGDD